MEILGPKKRNALFAAALSAAALAGCTIDSYLTDPSAVRCDGKRTKVDLAGDGMATFAVHGQIEDENNVATLQVRRNENGVSVKVDGDISELPQHLEADGFTTPVPVVDGAELSAFGAGGVWVIDVREDSVVIQGSCDGM